MRVDIYAEEVGNFIEVVEKKIDGEKFTGLRLHLGFLGLDGKPKYSVHRSVTFWGKQDLREGMRAILAAMDAHYSGVRNEESK